MHRPIISERLWVVLLKRRYIIVQYEWMNESCNLSKQSLHPISASSVRSNFNISNAETNSAKFLFVYVALHSHHQTIKCMRIYLLVLRGRSCRRLCCQYRPNTVGMSVRRKDPNLCRWTSDNSRPPSWRHHLLPVSPRHTSPPCSSTWAYL